MQPNLNLILQSQSHTNYFLFLLQAVHKSSLYATMDWSSVLYPGTTLSPGKSHPAAGPISVSEDAGGNDLAEGLEHALQLLLIHRYWQVGDVEVGGVLLLLLYS